MPFVLNSQSQFRFKASQYLEVSQVKFLFAKFAQQKRNNKFDYEPTQQEIEEEMVDQVNEMRSEIVETIQGGEGSEEKPLLQQEHPKHVSLRFEKPNCILQ